MNRSMEFSTRSENRYWWHAHAPHAFVPDAYRILSDEEWDVLSLWFDETDRVYGSGTGECGVPAISMLTALVNGNGIERVVQLGHFVGYSTLLLGMCLKRMGTGRLVSIDIDPEVTSFTQKYVDLAGIADQVSLLVGDSADPVRAELAVARLEGSPQLVFIDSAHTADQTIRELDQWYPRLAAGGFIVLHDSSVFAEQWDAAGGGGVHAGLVEFRSRVELNALMINEDFHGRGSQGRASLTYVDGCGLGIIQKPLVSARG